MKVDVAVDISRIEPLDDFREQKWPGVEPGVFIRETEGQAKARQEGIDKGGSALPSPPPLPAQLQACSNGDWPSSSREHCWCDLSRSVVGGQFIADGATKPAPPQVGHLDPTDLPGMNIRRNHLKKPNPLSSEGWKRYSIDWNRPVLGTKSFDRLYTC